MHSANASRLLRVCRRRERLVEPSRQGPDQGRGILVFSSTVGENTPKAEMPNSREAGGQTDRRQEKPKRRGPFPHQQSPL